MTAPRLTLSSIEISAFRGIREPIELPLDARITLVYAPNGTGKTSLCDAAEWLLCGRVDRLSSGSVEGQHGLRCKLAPQDLATSVSSAIEIDGKPYKICRDKDGIRRDGAVIDNAAWLRAIALPDADVRMAGNSAAAARATWLRGTRFLAGETLALLLDPGLEASRREQIFADLFGVRQIIDQERLVQDFATGLGQVLDRENAKLEDIRVRITGLRDELKVRVASLSTNIYQATSNALGRAGAALATVNPDFSTDLQWTSLRDQLSFVRASTQSVQDSLGQRRRQLGIVTQSFAMFASAEALRQQLENELTNTQVTHDRYQGELTTLETQMALTKHAIVAARDKITRWRRADARVETKRGAAIASAERAAIDMTSFGDIEVLPEFRLSPEEQFSRRGALLGVLELSAEAESRDVEEARLRALEGEAGPSSTQIETLRENAQRLAEEIRRERQASEHTRSAAEELRLAAAHYVDAVHGETSCPVCGHNWASAAALRNALDQATGALSAAEARTHERLLDLERQHSTAQAELQSATQQQIRLREAVERRAVLAAERVRFSELLATAGLTTTSGSYDTIARQAIARLTAVADLAALDDELRSVDAELQTGNIASGDPLRRSEDFSRLAHRQIAELESREAELTEVARQSRDRIEVVRASLAATRHLLDEAREQISTHRSRVSEVDKAWVGIAEGQTLSTAALETVRSGIEGTARTLGQVEESLAEAETLMTDVARQADLARLEHAETGLTARVDRLRGANTLGVATVEQFRKERRRRSAGQLIALTRVFSPLFARVQANEIFDRVGGDPTHWKAFAGSEEFDPTEHFSQGQRQDFALALFIARARSLSGTFFLDEPMSHLDDLNRVALLDVLRMLALDVEHPLQLVVTTASETLVRQLAAKFSPIGTNSGGTPLLRAIELSGNARSGVSATVMFEM